MKRVFFTLTMLLSLAFSFSAKENVLIHLKNGETQKIDVADIDSITFQEVTYNSNYEFVDLGLPSGTLWATVNVGATKPEEYGGYYAWGETETKETYSWSNYKYCNGTEKTLTKYGQNRNWGVVDGKTILDAEDDAATVNWGPEWCMPTLDQYTELFNETYVTWTFEQYNGVWGFYGTSKINGNKMFMPAGGSIVGNEALWREAENGDKSYGRYHTRSLYTPNSVSYDNYYIWFNKTPKSGNTGGYRSDGKLVRAVRK